jgi:hypothetical protein
VSPSSSYEVGCLHRYVYCQEGSVTYAERTFAHFLAALAPRVDRLRLIGPLHRLGARRVISWRTQSNSRRCLTTRASRSGGRAALSREIGWAYETCA